VGCLSRDRGSLREAVTGRPCSRLTAEGRRGTSTPRHYHRTGEIASTPPHPWGRGSPLALVRCECRTGEPGRGWRPGRRWGCRQQQGPTGAQPGVGRRVGCIY